jgi:hypothetical protein
VLNKAAGFGHNVGKHLNLDPARFEHPDLDVEEHLGMHSNAWRGRAVRQFIKVRALRGSPERTTGRAA